MPHRRRLDGQLGLRFRQGVEIAGTQGVLLDERADGQPIDCARGAVNERLNAGQPDILQQTPGRHHIDQERFRLVLTAVGEEDCRQVHDSIQRRGKARRIK